MRPLAIFLLLLLAVLLSINVQALVVLNSATGKTCSEVCNKLGCISAGTNSEGTNNYYYGPSCLLNYLNYPCSTIMHYTIRVCSYRAEWTYCNCQPSQPSCTDECTNGAMQCSGDSYKICGNYDSDSCLEFGNDADCGTINPQKIRMYHRNPRNRSYCPL